MEAIKYKKAFNGTTVFVEEVRTGKKELAFNTMYKQKTGSGSLQKPSALTSETTPQKTKVQQIIDNVKRKVSAVRDTETGEPLVVWHGTKKNGFSIFYTGEHSGNNGRRQSGAFFSADKDYANLYGENLTAVFLRNC